MKNKIILEIAGFRIGIYFNETEHIFYPELLKRQISECLGGFILKGNPKVDFSIILKSNRTIRSIFKKDQRTYYYEAVRIINKNTFECYYYIGITQLMHLLNHAVLILISKKGFIMHASAVAIKGRAFVFTGHENAGKSTAMNLLKKDFNPIADDSVIIKKVPGGYTVYQTPVVEKEWWIVKNSREYPLEGIFFLQKSPRFKLDRINDKKQRLFKTAEQLFLNEDLKSAQMAALNGLINKFNGFWVLSFDKNREGLVSFLKKHQDSFSK